MNKSELIKLKKLVNLEISRRERIDELLNNEFVEEYLELTQIPKYENKSDFLEVLKDILKDFEVKETNNIFVCTYSSGIDYDICYEETNTYSKRLKINSDNADFKIYTDIESGKKITAKKEENKYIDSTIKEFEKNNIVLNPYNSCDNSNGYEEVRLDFFNNCIKSGQNKSKNLILNKYPRI